MWKDYHFTHKTKYSEHALHTKNLAKQLLGINMYGVGEVDDALKIIKRKKYNKVILLSNVGIVDQAKKFIEDVRSILKFNVIVLFYTSKLSHLNWIKDFPNALFTISEDFFREYILNFNTNGLNTLKSKIETYYNQKLDKFKVDLSYPLFNEVKNKDYNYIEMD